MHDYSSGLTSLKHEQEPVRAEIQGRLPEWLRGTLIRNGPAGWNQVDHWFDGMAMLHSFTINPQGVVYRSRFLRGPDWCGMNQQGQLLYPQFASDPCRHLFKKVASLFVSDLGCNPNVNVVKIGRRWLALTETPMALEFDAETLQTLGLFDYDQDALHHHITSAHPILDNGVLHNFTVQLGKSSRYNGYRMGAQGARQIFAHHPTRHPAYLHSCGLTAREMLLWEGPFVVNPLQLLWRNRPYIENFCWRPELGSRLLRLGRDGTSQAYELPPLFVFHHVNSFYEGDCLCVDLLAYQDARLISQLYLKELRQPEGQRVETPHLVRVRVEGTRTSLERLSQTPIELPRIVERQGHPYRYLYGITQQQSRFYDGLVRLDCQREGGLFWYEPGCFAGEPIPQKQPGGEEIVLLSVVLDTRRQQSFLLVLDAQTMTERARAYVPAVVPFGFHGGFTDEL